MSFAACTLLYTALAFLEGKMFGAEVNPRITLSLPRHHFLTKIALWATVLTPMTKYALEFAPFTIQLENNLPDSLSSRMKLIIRGFVGSILLLVILSLALSVPYFEHVLSLTGSLVSVCICMTFPCAFYIKLSWPHISKPLLILNLPSSPWFNSWSTWNHFISRDANKNPTQGSLDTGLLILLAGFLHFLTCLIRSPCDRRVK